jgi:ribonuclease D
MREAKLIQHPDELEAALFRLRGADRLALDTEFMRESTYHPQLCLIQVATVADCCLIDPLAGLDLAPLHELLLERTRLKILHAARQDLEVLSRAAGAVPGPLFDTQVAAAFLGFAPQIGYAELVARQLGHSIDKGQTRTDWSKRPLTAAQLAYAADDVRHLLTLQTELHAALITKGRDDWATQEMATLEDLSLYRTDPADAWRRLKGLNRLRPAEQAAARALAQWREQRALDSDRPRGWILADDALYALATRAPATLESLAAVPGVPPGVVRKRGEELLSLLQDTRAHPAPQPVPPPRRPTAEEQSLAGALMQAVRQVAESLELGPELLATRRDVEALAYGSVPLERSPLLRGWRGQVLGDALRARCTRPAEVTTG